MRSWRDDLSITSGRGVDVSVEEVGEDDTEPGLQWVFTLAAAAAAAAASGGGGRGGGGGDPLAELVDETGEIGHGDFCLILALSPFELGSRNFSLLISKL